MSNDAEFINGLIVKAPNENAPDYVKAKGWIKNAELVAYLQTRIAAGEESTNFDVKVSQGGKWYAVVDNWKPQSGGSSGSRGGAPQREPRQAATSAPVEEFDSTDIPFVSQNSTF